MNIRTSLLVGLVLVAFIAQALGHSYLTNPISRSNQRESTTGCRGPNCLGPCDRPRSAATRAPITIARGASISVQWPRNNHAGGFIRLAWAPTAQSDSHAAFDAGVQQISCHEVGGCRPDSASDPNGGDSGPADGSSRACSTSITVPTHLPDGAYTLQWSWFGGAFALGDYYSCVDYRISGGPQTSSPAAPVFKGGDYTYPGQQKCKFFNTDRLHQCVNEPCNRPIFDLNRERSGLPFMAGIVTPTSPPTAAPTQAPTQAPTAAPTQAPTAAPTQAPTQQPTQAPTSAPTQAPTQAPSGGQGNCARLTTLSSSRASVQSVNTWGTTFQAVITVQVAENRLSDWGVEIDFPSSMGTATVNTVYNAGKLKCTAPGDHAVVVPAAGWANNVSQGTVLTIELQGTNPNRISDSAIANGLRFKVYKS